MKTLIAGFGNILFGDDGFGPAAIRLLEGRELGDDVRVHDFGISGMHLALEMLEPYELVILVDAIARDDPPGTLYVVEPSRATATNAPNDPHSMDVRTVLSLYERLRAEIAPTQASKVLIVGCVPEATDEGMELSHPVRAALARSAELIQDLVSQHAVAGAVQR